MNTNLNNKRKKSQMGMPNLANESIPTRNLQIVTLTQTPKPKLVGLNIEGLHCRPTKMENWNKKKCEGGFDRTESIWELNTYLWFPHEYEKCSDSEDKIALPLCLARTVERTKGKCTSTNINLLRISSIEFLI